MRKAIWTSIFLIGALVPKISFAANVYIPWLCEVNGNALDCAPDFAGASQGRDGGWDIEFDDGDTVYFRVSDFTDAAAGAVSVSAETIYATSNVPWTKSGSTSTSLGETDDADLSIEFEGQSSSGSSSGGCYVRLRREGG